MARIHLPEFIVKLKRFFLIKEADQDTFSNEISNVQPVAAILLANDSQTEEGLVELQALSNTIPALKVSLTDDDTDNPITIPGAGNDTQSAASIGLLVNTRSYSFDGVTWRRNRVPDSTNASAGASALTILAAAGADNFNRIHDIVLSTDNAGLVVLSDGLPSIQLPANGSIRINFKDGWKQDTANTAITATLAGATLAAGVTFNVEL